MPWTGTVDAKFDKGFALAGFRYQAFVEIKNLLDKKNVLEVYSDTGTWNGNKTAIESDPSHLGAGRNVRIGFEVTW